MALLFCDSFDHYATANINTKYFYSPHASLSIGAYGRFSTNGLRWNSSNITPTTAYIVTRSLPGDSTYIAGIAVYISSWAAAPLGILSFYENGTLHVDVRCSNAGLVYFTRSGTTIGVQTANMTLDSWHYVEAKVVVGDSPNGSVGLRIDGVTVISESGLDTKNGGSGVIDRVAVGPTPISPTATGVNLAYFDDFYVCDSSNSQTYLGDVRIQYINPTANGFETDFTPSVGTNYETVNETTTVDDADYNVASASGSIDSFVMADIASTGTVFGVQSVIRHWKTDAGIRYVRPKFRIGSTYYNGSDALVGVSVAYDCQSFDVSPATASGWTDTEVNGMEFGYEVAS